MSIDREAIYAALFTRLQAKLLVANGGSFRTVGRRHRMPPQDLTPDHQPALFQCEAQEDTQPRPGGTGGKKTLHALLFVYVFIPNVIEIPGAETVLPGTQLNQLLKSIDDAIAPDSAGNAGSAAWAPQNTQTLGGLVHHVWVEGQTDLDPAIFGPQASAVVPIHILCP